MSTSHEDPQDVDDVEGHARMRFSSGSLGGEDGAEGHGARGAFSSGALAGEDDVEGHSRVRTVQDEQEPGDEQQGDGGTPSFTRI